jgi:hypothetical protein
MDFSPTTVKFLISSKLRNCPSAFEIPIQRLRVASLTSFGDFNARPVIWIQVEIRFSGSTPFGEKTSATLKANDLVTMLRYIEASHTPH